MKNLGAPPNCGEKSNTVFLYMRQIRVHHWSKNFLVFFPLTAAHAFHDLRHWTNAGLAFLSFCAAASLAYCFNDLLDVSFDRIHPENRKRPYASGEIDLAEMYVLLAFLIAATGICTFFLVTEASVWIAAYLALNALYPAAKRIAGLDLFFLTGFYLLRILAGGGAGDTSLTLWILTFSFFFFMNLAALKRVYEISVVPTSKRPYRATQLRFLLVVGQGAAMLSICTLAAYINWAAPLLYSRPLALWGAVAMLAFWLWRIWRLYRVKNSLREPVEFVLTDGPTWGILLGSILCIVCAI